MLKDAHALASARTRGGRKFGALAPLSDTTNPRLVRSRRGAGVARRCFQPDDLARANAGESMLNADQLAAATAPISQPLAVSVHLLYWHRRRPPAHPPTHPPTTRPPAHPGPQVVAGAGCGKTATLVERVRHISHSGPAATTILVLTFSNKAAVEVRSRCSEHHLNVACLTFHSFALKVLNEFGEEGAPRVKPLGQAATSKLVNEAVAETAAAGAGAASTDGWEEGSGGDEDKRAAIAKRMVAVISKAKGRMVPPEQLADPHARGVYERYLSKMRTAGHADFEDLILRCNELLKQQRVAELVTAKFSHVLVDEYQVSRQPTCCCRRAAPPSRFLVL